MLENSVNLNDEHRRLLTFPQTDKERGVYYSQNNNIRTEKN